MTVTKTHRFLVSLGLDFWRLLCHTKLKVNKIVIIFPWINLLFVTGASVMNLVIRTSSPLHYP
jgi:hypothetical protein